MSETRPENKEKYNEFIRISLTKTNTQITPPHLPTKKHFLFCEHVISCNKVKTTQKSPLLRRQIINSSPLLKSESNNTDQYIFNRTAPKPHFHYLIELKPQEISVSDYIDKPMSYREKHKRLPVLTVPHARIISTNNNIISELITM
ncbi:MAG: hypothetical protein JKX76_01200 [Colwellia sp.]|nr:hypothetical protein [Colwellia sp.]